MRTAIVVPYRSDLERDRLLAWTLGRYAEEFPDAPVVFGDCNPDLPFNRSEAILNGASKTDADVLVVADGDCFSSGIHDAVAAVEQGAAWAVPHLMLCRLSEAATARVLAGEQPEDQDDFAERPYKGFEAGTLVVVSRSTIETAPPEIRCLGWGQDDQIWSLAMRCLVGAPWRGKAPLFHLWHEPQPRRNRAVGNNDNLALYKRYKAARTNPARMRALIDEAKECHAKLLRAALGRQLVPD